ncbi:hypothetical protein HGB24_02215 [Candidatus Saccharibacteria bacterium]|nr:hypothetical protein [Candidatus Saccharibacteria bacterium]
MKIVKKINKDNETGARKQLIEELFYDFHKNRYQIYWMNFLRGVYFGFGTVLGGTVVVTFLIWLLGQFSGWLPDSIGHWISLVVDSIQKSSR